MPKKTIGFSSAENKLKSEFIDYIVKAWLGEFEHGYDIKPQSPAWKPWALRNPGGKWCCHNLCDACKKYAWFGESHNNDIVMLNRDLISVLKTTDDKCCAEICLAIFKWGGVARRPNDKSRLWIEAMALENLLIERLYEGIELLQPSCKKPLDVFDGDYLLMNSSLTKVYALGDKARQVIIYDGRVGAALGLLARNFLVMQGHNRVPDCLAFPWGPPATPSAMRQKTRDPSTETLQFPQFRYGSNADFERAKWGRWSNQILTKVVQIVNQKTKNQSNYISVNDLEKALFMVGYDVRSRAL